MAGLSSRLRRIARIAAMGCLVWFAAMLGCVSIPTGTYITPEYFQYATIFSPDSDGVGGWRAVCIKARVGQRVAHPKRAHVENELQCGFEFGSPIANRQLGFIPLRTAQRVSADVANEVAYKVLQTQPRLSARACRRMIDGMNREFSRRIRASTVTQCGVTNWSHQVPVVHWPPVH